jgi:hypothetical protein
MKAVNVIAAASGLTPWAGAHAERGPFPWA